MFPKRTIYAVYLQTGCSCCHDDNYTEGPFTLEEAQAFIDKAIYGDGPPPIASQYARRGRYDILEIEIEELPDGRIIAYDKVWDPKEYDFPRDIDGKLVPYSPKKPS